MINPWSTWYSSRNACGALFLACSVLLLRSNWRSFPQSACGYWFNSSVSALSPSSRRRLRHCSVRCKVATSRCACMPLALSFSRIASSVVSSSRRICLARKASWRLRAMCDVIRLVSVMCGSNLSGIGSLANWAGVSAASFRRVLGLQVLYGVVGCGWGQGIRRFLYYIRALHHSSTFKNKLCRPCT